MKKQILSITGLVAFGALMLFNIEVTNTDNSSNIMLSAVKNSVSAQSEGGVILSGDPHIVYFQCPNGTTKSSVNCFSGTTVCVPQSNNCN